MTEGRAGNSTDSLGKVVAARPVKLTTRTGVEVHRFLPQAGLRKISAWCFLDHFGPTAEKDAMVVAAHPHTGLQTATWLIDGEVEHRDSLGTVQRLLPGEFNLMTAGKGIAHSELGSPGLMHAVQLWIALPEDSRNQEPRFEHHAELPKLAARDFSLKVFAGSFMGVTSPAKIHSPLFGAELTIDSEETFELALNSRHEVGVLALTGSLRVNGKMVQAGELYQLDPGSTSMKVSGPRPGTKALVIGGEPFDERLVMWWNFIGRSHEEIVEMRSIWNNRGSEDPALVAQSHAKFGRTFTDRVGGWIPAPDLPNVELRSR